MTAKLVLIDGHALAYRAFFGMPATFRTAMGEPTNAVYGFLNMILAVWHEYQPDYFVVTFDLGDTFRHEKYAEYKATREKMPDDLRTQIRRIEQAVRAFNMPVFTKEGYEADDLLGTLAYQAAEQGVEALIVTGDRDAFQLVRPNVKVIISGKKFSERESYDEAAVEARYGLSPNGLIELKGLVGDTSDNIPGVHGIGEKGGSKLIQKYGTLENLYDHLDEQTKSVRAKLEAGREKAFLSRDLGRIVTDVPGVQLDLVAGRTMDFDLVEVANLFVELEFNTIFNRIPGAPAGKRPADFATVEPPQPEKPPEPTPPDGDYQVVDTPHKLTDLLTALQQSDKLAVDVETDDTDEVLANLIGIAISPTAGQGYYIPLQHGLRAHGQQATMFDAPTEEVGAPPQLPLDTVQSALGSILASPTIVKYMHNAKFDIAVLERHGLPVANPIFDTMVASWLTNNATEARHGLKELALSELNIKMTPIKELIGSGKKQLSMAQIPIADVTPYASADVDLTLRLAEVMHDRLAEHRYQQIFETLELPLIHILKEMELTGIRLDVPALKEMSGELNGRLDTLTEEIYEAAGQKFNVNSTQQLSDLLFGKFDLPTHRLKKTKSGHYSTSAGVLERLQGLHPVVDLILEQRQLAKLISTYVDALPSLVNPATGRVHTNYNQIGISTGRLSSSNPNLQNIPIRTAQGRQIRRAFIAQPGWKLIAADYSQIELRILAHIAHDPSLLTAFRNDEDVHSATAAAVLGIPLNEVSKDQRRIAKTVNFGLVYGQTAFGLAQGTGMSQRDARSFIDTYFKKYPGVKRYIDVTKKMAADNGYIETLVGRRRLFANVKSLNGMQKGRVEREAINAPIQGTAADIMKQAMIDLHRALAKSPLQANMLLQVHDELVLEAPADEVAETVQLVREVMSAAFSLDVPLKVELEVGDNWLDMGN